MQQLLWLNVGKYWKTENCPNVFGTRFVWQDTQDTMLSDLYCLFESVLFPGTCIMYLFLCWYVQYSMHFSFLVSYFSLHHQLTHKHDPNFKSGFHKIYAGCFFFKLSWLKAKKYSWGCQFGPLAHFFLFPPIAGSAGNGVRHSLEASRGISGFVCAGSGQFRKSFNSKLTKQSHSIQETPLAPTSPLDSGWSSTQLARGFIIWSLILRRIARSKQWPFPIAHLLNACSICFVDCSLGGQCSCGRMSQNGWRRHVATLLGMQ